MSSAISLDSWSDVKEHSAWISRLVFCLFSPGLLKILLIRPSVVARICWSGVSTVLSRLRRLYHSTATLSIGLTERMSSRAISSSVKSSYRLLLRFTRCTQLNRDCFMGVRSFHQHNLPNTISQSQLPQQQFPQPLISPTLTTPVTNFPNSNFPNH